MTQLQDADELTSLEARREAAKEAMPLAFEAWLETLSRIRVRIESGALAKTEKKLSLAAIAVIEEDLGRAWQSLQTRPSVEPRSHDDGFREAEVAREQILDELVKLRVALTANLNQTVGVNK